MPAQTRWFIKTAFVYFILALMAGVALGVQAIRPFNPPVADLMPTYFHLLAAGWITMLIIGVVFWLFPKLTLQRPHGSEKLGWVSYILLNLGLILRVISEPTNAMENNPASVWAILLTVAAGLQWLGGITFVINSWGRVKEK